MPARPLMSWNKSQRRWEKMHRGQRYWVTCTELGLPADRHNKEDSYQAANAWWERTLAEHQAARHALHPHRIRLDELQAHRDASKALGEHKDADVLDAEIIRVTALPPEYDPEDEEGAVPRGIDTAKLRTVETNYVIDQHVREPDRPADIDPQTAATIQGLRALGFNLDDPVVAAVLSRSNAVRADRAKRVTITPPENTVGALVGKWVSNVQEEARKGVRSSDGAAALEVCVNHFRDFVGPSNPPEVITADLWVKWYNRCREMVARRDAADGKREKGEDRKLKSWSADTAKKVFGVSRSFVKWLWTVEKLPALPRNLTDRTHRFEAEDKDPAVFKTAEIHTLLKAAKGVHRLILLLSLNCGMYGKDISDLKKTQIDWEKGRITRRRSKTRRLKGVPKVSYRLWPQTLESLREHVNKDSQEPRALVTKSGQPWVWTETLESGKKKKSDNVATIFNNLKKRAGMSGADKSFKTFRKTSATKIGNSEKYARLRVLFLGHKDRAVSDKHYVRTSRKALFKAIGWLKKVYKLDEVIPPPRTDDGPA